VKLPMTGGCVCGAVRYEITHASIRVYACHCTDCQRVTTSAFSIGVSVPGEAFRVTGKELRPVPGGVTEGGRAKTRWVCPDCGIWLCGGTLDDTSWLRPTLHLFTRSKQPWVILPEDATDYEAAPPRA
jgi:hypothetical protein